MKMVKSAFLASAAGLVAMSGAQAADLPVKAKPVEYVKVCSLYGAGFYYIPGTDICMKVGGYIRFQQNFGSTDITAGPMQGIGALNNRVSSADYTYRSRAIASFDTRQQTAYGTLRTYLILGVSQDSGTDGTAGGNVVRLYATRAFIQISGFTFGKATSFFDFVSTAAVAYNAGNTFTPDTGDGGHVVAAYTAQFGNGLSATISAEQERTRGTWWLGSAIAGGGGGATAVNAELAGTNRLQDIVANLRVDQAWGSAQIAAALHDASASYYGSGPGGANIVEWNGHPEQKWGWAATAGIRLNAPMIGPGDYFQAAVHYAVGATQYTSNTPATWNVAQGQAVAVSIMNDGGFTGTAVAPGTYELATAWSVFASYEHFWTPSLRTSIYGSYWQSSLPDGLNDAMCRSGVANSFALGGVFTGSATSRANGCDLDSSRWNIGSRSQWNITKDLYVGVDVMYTKVNTATLNNAGTATLATATAGKAVGVYNTSDLDAFSATWRIHRDIVP
jgi:hypothetical protein